MQTYGGNSQDQMINEMLLYSLTHKFDHVVAAIKELKDFLVFF